MDYENNVFSKNAATGNSVAAYALVSLTDNRLFFCIVIVFLHGNDGAFGEPFYRIDGAFATGFCRISFASAEQLFGTVQKFEEILFFLVLRYNNIIAQDIVLCVLIPFFAPEREV